MLGLTTNSSNLYEQTFHAKHSVQVSTPSSGVGLCYLCYKTFYCFLFLKEHFQKLHMSTFTKESNHYTLALQDVEMVK